MKNRKMLGNAMLLCAALIWGLAFVFQRKGMDYIEPFTFCFARMYLPAAALSLLTLISDAVRKKKGTALSDSMSPEEYSRYKRNTLIGGICCGLCLSGGSSFQQFGLVYTTAGKAGFITALYMLLVPVIGVLFLKKKVSWLTWLGVFTGAFGLYLLSIKGDFSLGKGDGLVMICAVFYTLHILSCDYFAPRGNILRMSVIQFLVAAAVTTVLAFIYETPTWEKLMSAAFPIIFCGLLSGAVAFTFQMAAQQFTEPTVASLLMSLESVFAALGGAVILHETMSSREITGCIIMFAAIVLVQIPMPERK